MTKAEAKRLCLNNWALKIENGGDYSITVGKDERAIEIKKLNLKFDCAYCQKYLHTSSERIEDCFGCPIRIKSNKRYNPKEFGCFQNSHPFKIWNKNKTVKNAQNVYNLIKKS